MKKLLKEGPVPHGTQPANWPDALMAAVRSGPLALFVGSGVSRDRPSLLPTGNELRDAMFDAIVSHSIMPEHLLDAARVIALRCRPESFLYILEEWQGTDWKKSLQFMLDVPPNDNHRLIARLAETKRVRSILTTNFDCLVESSMGQSVSFRQIFRNQDFKAYAGDKSTTAVLKLHGSLADTKGNLTQETIMASLTKVADRVTPGFAAEKALVLDEILQSHVVVFLGYSGRDEFDIRPVIEGASAKQIIWVSHIGKREKFRVVRASDIDSKAQLDSPDELMMAHPGMIRIYAHTRTFLSDLCAFLVAGPADEQETASEEGQEPARKVPSSLLTKSPFSFLALVFRMARDWKHGAEASELALSDMLYLRGANDHSVAELYRHRGACRKGLGQFEAARADFDRALKLCEEEYADRYEQSANPLVHQAHFVMMSQICEDVALTDLAAGELDSAEEWMRKAVWWSKRLTFPRQIAFFARNCANWSLIAKEKFLKTRDRSKLAEAFQLAKASEVGTASGALVELVRSLSNEALLCLETQRWNEALAKAMKGLSIAAQTEGPHGETELRNLKATAVAALCGLATDDDEATACLQCTAQEGRTLDASAVHACLEVFGEAKRLGLCFANNPEAVSRSVKGVFDLVSE